MTSPHERHEAEQRAALERLDRLRHDGDGLLTSALAQEAQRAAPDEANADDPAEVWGRRIGRGLSIAAFVALLVYLSVTYLP
jgi:ferric-dicitrate binding protein FerR (iron transport regulator)